MRQYNTIYVPTICDKNTIDIRTVYEQNDNEYVIGTVKMQDAANSIDADQRVTLVPQEPSGLLLSCLHFTFYRHKACIGYTRSYA